MDPPVLLRPTPRLPSAAQSPERKSRHKDDSFLAQLRPSTAVVALSTATGPWKTCLENASPAERDFALRAAITSKQLWEWMEELEGWEWPDDGGSAGFEAPRERTRRKLFDSSGLGSTVDGAEYIGCLPAQRVLAYETRIECVHQEMENLSIEEIKSHVMNNHIIPLSRPGTPSSIMSGISMRSTTFNRLEDLTAIITGVVVQALPVLAKLVRLLQIWTLRLKVLNRLPSLMNYLTDAEVALQSGWNAISKQGAKREQTKEPSLTRNDFNVMKQVLEQRVAKPGRTLDFMLDCLEGLPDTLPDAWLDRMEVAEHDYANWVAACEKRIRETEWARHSRLREASRTPSPAKSPVPSVDEPSTDSADTPMTPQVIIDSPEDETLDSSDFADESVISLDGPFEEYRIPRIHPPTPIPEENESSSPIKRPHPRRWDEEETYSPSSPWDKESSPELPPLRADNRRESILSQTSTVIHQDFDDDFSDMPEVSASPIVPKDKIREAEYLQVSPPSSPPVIEDSRELSVAIPDSSLVDNSGYTDASPAPDTPPEDSTMDDFDDSFSVSDVLSPTERRDSVGDRQLRHQITQIIENLPAKIKLANELPAINLNPPGLKLPKLNKKPSIDRFRRSTSALSTTSSRAGTPSFTLSPAKGGRRPRGQQEIKVYHLSRSTGEAPIKLHIRCVGEHGERVMVRVGGGWADLSEYLKEYATHHGRRSAGSSKAAKVEVRDLPRVIPRPLGSSPNQHRSVSAMDSPTTPLSVRKTRRSVGALDNPRLRPKTPIIHNDESSVLTEDFTRSRSNSQMHDPDDESSYLGLAGPSGRRVDMSEENKAWVESVKEKVRIASGERKVSGPPGPAEDKNRFGQIGKVGGTKRLFPRAESRGSEKSGESRTEFRPGSRLEKRAESRAERKRAAD